MGAGMMTRSGHRAISPVGSSPEVECRCVAVVAETSPQVFAVVGGDEIPRQRCALHASVIAGFERVDAEPRCRPGVGREIAITDIDRALGYERGGALVLPLDVEGVDAIANGRRE